MSDIVIRPLEIRDAEQLLRLEMKNKNFFQRYTPLRTEMFYTLEGQRELVKEHVQQAKKGIGYYFGIFLVNDQLIGKISLAEIVRGDLQSCWLGYCLDQEQNGKGYMTEAVKFVVDFAFKELKLHRIEAGVMPHNKGSIRVLEKAGFHKEGLSKKNVRINGKWEDHQLLAILNPDD
ncbi:GNAT family N-acetyltransferase [Melghirimyces algeriensis]|uniref:Ribosomal-protein-alanine N-acetyltransferase n=1 Tax=Melghirimyces algeriensis TaxID=910412 RepID=A0A521DIC0_9BACL|nr:GNAT family protein [Melghirimyces algeriensis]SMO71335.1 ribosomal-protein-alanine N-acetyltransferase [Melghirimyces algeriensis]